LIESGELASDMETNGITGLLSATVELDLLPVTDAEVQETQVEQAASQVGLIAGIVVAAVLLIIAGVMTFVFCRRRRAKIGDENMESVDSEDIDKPKRKDLMDEDTSVRLPPLKKWGKRLE